jgi:5-methylcytosine-specific restriction endonuclease McrA
MDHFEPKKRGGGDDPSNLVTSCDICNFMKGPWKEWPTLEEARNEIKNWHRELEAFWEKNVRHLL